MPIFHPSTPIWVPPTVIGWVALFVLITLGSLLWHAYSKRRDAKRSAQINDSGSVGNSSNSPQGVFWVVTQCSVGSVYDGTWASSGVELAAGSTPLRDSELLTAKVREPSSIIDPDRPPHTSVFVWWLFRLGEDPDRRYPVDTYVVTDISKASSVRNKLLARGHMLEIEIAVNGEGVLVPTIPLRHAIDALQTAGRGK